MLQLSINDEHSAWAEEPLESRARVGVVMSNANWWVRGRGVDQWLADDFMRLTAQNSEDVKTFCVWGEMAEIKIAIILAGVQDGDVLGEVSGKDPAKVGVLIDKSHCVSWLEEALGLYCCIPCCWWWYVAVVVVVVECVHFMIVLSISGYSRGDVNVPGVFWLIWSLFEVAGAWLSGAIEGLMLRRFG